MLYLCGRYRPELLTHPLLGFMATPANGNHPPLRRLWWAADTGCFRHPERFDPERYLAWLAKLRPEAQRCLFATAPDVVSDAQATWARSAPLLPRLRALGYRAALVAQDGLEQLPIDWETFDCLFVGGSTAWKLSEAAYALVCEASQRGKWTHLGRVNSLRRLRAAQAAGYDSADGNKLLYAPDQEIITISRWATTLATQPPLALASA